VHLAVADARFRCLLVVHKLSFIQFVIKLTTVSNFVNIENVVILHFYWKSSENKIRKIDLYNSPYRQFLTYFDNKMTYFDEI
jgi:hypothetical protein